jgi:hypothetical protein
VCRWDSWPNLQQTEREVTTLIYGTPELSLVGVAQNLVLGSYKSYGPSLACVSGDGKGSDSLELW